LSPPGHCAPRRRASPPPPAGRDARACTETPDPSSQSGPVGWVCLGLYPRARCSVRTSSSCQRRSAATVSRHASAQAASSTPTPDSPMPVHAAQMSIDSNEILRNMTSGSGISACEAPPTAQRTACRAACRRKAASRGGRLLVKRSAHCAASGTAPTRAHCLERETVLLRDRLGVRFAARSDTDPGKRPVPEIVG
jgi:hypothetical protein